MIKKIAMLLICLLPLPLYSSWFGGGGNNPRVQVDINLPKPTAEGIENFVNTALPAIGKAVKENIGGKGFQSGAKEIGTNLGQALSSGGQSFTENIQFGAGKIGANLGGAYASGAKEFAPGLNAGLSEISNVFKDNINDFAANAIFNNLIKYGYISAAITFATTALYYGIPFAYRMLERWMIKPKLVIDSSKKSWYQYLFGKKVANLPMIFAPSLEKRLNEIVQTTKTIQKKIKEGKTNVGYRNLMLYGAPGTGKTLFATELAKRCGLEYVFMSGSSFSKFKGGEGIEALDELFAWAKRSSGLMIFIDEAESFLSKRENMDPQSQAYLLLNNFLNYTGKRSNKFMLVFATNHKDVLDSAMYRRIDDLVEFPLPGKEERIRILDTYKDIILMDKTQNDATFVQSVEKELTKPIIEKIAEVTQGLSGSELEAIINSLKTSADIADPAIITKNLINATVAQAMEKHLAFTKGIPASQIAPILVFDDAEKIIAPVLASERIAIAG